MQCSKPLFRLDSSKSMIYYYIFTTYQTMVTSKLVSKKYFYSLSKRKLVAWLKLILRNQTVVETLYQPWSYTVTTGISFFVSCFCFVLLQHLSF